MSLQKQPSSRAPDGVEENFYLQGLLDRPRRTPSSAYSPSGRRQPIRAHSAPERPTQANKAREPLLETGHPRQFKQTSISSGTLQRHYIASADRLPLAHPAVRGASKTVAFVNTNPVRAQSDKQMAVTIEGERSRPRLDRTYVGGACAACEELLEHTLAGEKILQLSCGHVAHEACFYEYIKDADAQYCPSCDAPLGLDSSRGGSILDLSKLSSLVRSIAQQNDSTSPRNSTATPMPWDGTTLRPGSNTNTQGTHGVPALTTPDVYRSDHRDSRDSQRMRIERLGLITHHSRDNSGTETATDSNAPDQHSNDRKHDYDVHAMETTVPTPRSRDARDTVPAPVVTVRSEFPTLVRSRQQQSLTCIVSVEVPQLKGAPVHDGQMPTPSLPRGNKHAGALFDPKSEERRARSRPAPGPAPAPSAETTEELKARVDNWHGLDFSRFGQLRLHGALRVGKDGRTWQELECYLFDEMLICVKEKKTGQPVLANASGKRLTRCTLKGSILIKRHLKMVQSNMEELVLTLNLSVAELQAFHLQFASREVLNLWRHALISSPSIDVPPPSGQDDEPDTSGTDDDDYARRPDRGRRSSSNVSSWGGPKSSTTAATEYSSANEIYTNPQLPPSRHAPLDVVVVIPVSSSMQGLKISLLRDALRFLVENLGDRDRMGLVTFGSGQGGVPLVGMTTKRWTGWNKAINSIRPVGQKSLRADVVEGANVAMDLLMQRKAANPISSILLISDSSTSETDSVDFVVQRAEAAKVGIYSFGLGLTHKPDSMIELSSRTKASYVYVKDWMMLRECVAGCLGSLQSISHQNARLRLKLPEGSQARFVKISGALNVTRRASGRDAEAALGDLRHGDKRDVLVQLAIDPDIATQESFPQDHWETIVSSLEALGGHVEPDDQRVQSVEEAPVLQADLSWRGVSQDGATARLSRPSLLTITVLPAPRTADHGDPHLSPPIPPHPSIIQRRMELLASDMLTRALTLVSRGQHDRAYTLLNETRTILRGFAKGGLPPLPANARFNGPKRGTHQESVKSPQSPRVPTPDTRPDSLVESDRETPVPRSIGVDHHVMTALDSDMESSLEWINHPAVFLRDSRKAVLQAIGVISSQRGFTFRTSSEAMWAERISGVKRLVEASRTWRELGESLTEE